VDHSGSLGCLGEFSDGPAAHLIGSGSEVVNEIEGVVPSLDDLREHAALLLVLVLEFLAFMLSAVGDDLSGNVFINPFLDLLQPLVLLGGEVLLAEIDQIDY
jgi:hypothetical protein